MRFDSRRIVSAITIAAVALTFPITGTAEPAQAAPKANTSLVEGKDAAAKLFNPLNPIKIEMTIPQASWNAIQDNPNTTSYKAATIRLQLDGKYLTNSFNSVAPTEWSVGFRLKGRASRRDLSAKAPFKIKIDKFVSNQTLLGLKKLTLNNMVQDGSMVRESIIFRLYRGMGVPAPRTGYANVYVTSPGQGDNAYFGLYLNIETPDEVMLARWFGNRTQHLYESAYDTDVTSDYYSQYLDSIDVGSEDDFSDLLDFLPISDLTGEEWWEAVQDKANMKEILSLMAVDIFTSNWDGYTDFVRNNHYAHFDTSDVLSILPWGNDQSYPSDEAFFFAFDGSNPDPRGWSNVRSIMYRRCVTVPECNYELMQSIDRVAQTTTKLKLAAEITTLKSVIGSNARADNRKEVSNSEFESQLAYVATYQGDRISEWNSWKSQLAPEAPEATVSCVQLNCTFVLSEVDEGEMPAATLAVEQFVKGKWAKLKAGSGDSFTIKAKALTGNFRLRGGNDFGTSGWAIVTH